MSQTYGEVVISDGEVYEELVNNYQETGLPTDFNLLEKETSEYLYVLTKKHHKSVKGYGITESEVNQEVYIAFWKAAENFDGSRGSNFISYLQKRVYWQISDNIIRPYHSKKNELNKDTLSLDVPDEHGNMVLDNETFEKQGGKEMELEVLKLVEQFQSYGTDAEHNVVEIVFDVILEKGNADPDVVNQELYEEYPDLAKGSVRAKKKRALKKFKEFCELDGSEVNIEEII